MIMKSSKSIENEVKIVIIPKIKHVHYYPRITRKKGYQMWFKRVCLMVEAQLKCSLMIHVLESGGMQFRRLRNAV